MEKELSIDNKSFYDIPKISPSGSSHPHKGSVKGIPNELAMSESCPIENIPDVPQEKNAPLNKRNAWNCGGDGTWFSMFKNNGLDDKY